MSLTAAVYNRQLNQRAERLRSVSQAPGQEDRKNLVHQTSHSSSLTPQKTKDGADHSMAADRDVRRRLANQNLVAYQQDVLDTPAD